MRAVSYAEVRGALLVVEVDEPVCPEDGAVVQVRATGVCRSDWHAWRGHDPVPLPMVPGHEFAGVVVETGPRVDAFVVGDRVTAPFVNGCGDCDLCRDGQAQVCPEQTQPGFTHPGSFAERVVVRHADTNLVALPDDLGFVQAAALGCRFATAYHALTAQAGLRDGEWLVVYGAGGVGLSAVMIAASLGARVVAVDPSPAARERALELGAEIALGRGDDVRELTDGGAHVALDAVGRAESAIASVHSLRRRGRHVQVGLMLGADAAARLPWDLVVAHELRVMGSHGMPAVDYPPLLAMIRSGRLDPGLLVGSIIDLDHLGEALTAMDEPTYDAAGLVVAALPG